MKFTSLVTIVISAAAVAGVAIASEDQVMLPMGLPCSHPGEHPYGLRADLKTAYYLRLSTDTVDCIGGFKSLNNGNDIGVLCGPQGTVTAYKACACKNCCAESTADRFSFIC